MNNQSCFLVFWSWLWNKNNIDKTLHKKMPKDIAPAEKSQRKPMETQNYVLHRIMLSKIAFIFNQRLLMD